MARKLGFIPVFEALWEEVNDLSSIPREIGVIAVYIFWVA
jgi:hypothetical protein